MRAIKFRLIQKTQCGTTGEVRPGMLLTLHSSFEAGQSKYLAFDRRYACHVVASPENAVAYLQRLLQAPSLRALPRHDHQLHTPRWAIELIVNAAIIEVSPHLY